MRITPLVLAILFVLGLNQAANAQMFYNRVGSLDTTLNGVGYVGISGGNTYPTRVKQLSDRSIILIGYDNNNIRVVKMRADGTADPTFGNGGYSDIACPQCLMKDVVELTDGKLLLAGETNFMMQPTDLLLTRLNANGSRDTTFGTNGFVQHDLPVGSGQFSDEHMGEIALLPDGSVLAAALRSISMDHVNKECRGVLAKFLPSGALDASFGTNGFSETILGLEPVNLTSYSAQISRFTDGRSVAAFNSFIQDPNEPIGYVQKGVAVKYLADGQPDNSFPPLILSRDSVTDVATTAENGMLVLTDGKLRKFGADGQPDATFGADGTVTFPMNSYPGFLSVQPSGKIYVTGYKGAFSSSQPNWNPGQVLRLWPNGMRDLRFGRSGEAMISIDHQALYLGPAFVESDGTLALTGTRVPNNVLYIRLKVQK